MAKKDKNSDARPVPATGTAGSGEHHGDLIFTPLKEICASPPGRGNGFGTRLDLYPPDKDIDRKVIAKDVEKVGAALKKDLTGKGKLSAETLKELEKLMNYGFEHGQKGIDEVLKMLNEHLNGTEFKLERAGMPQKQNDVGEKGNFLPVKVSRRGDFVCTVFNSLKDRK